MSIQFKSGTFQHTQAAAGTFTRVTFDTPFPVRTQVVVHAMLQTYEGRDTPDVRVQNVSETGFEVMLNEVMFTDAATQQFMRADGVHARETMGWIAVGNSTDSGRP